MHDEMGAARERICCAMLCRMWSDIRRLMCYIYRGGVEQEWFGMPLHRWQLASSIENELSRGRLVAEAFEKNGYCREYLKDGGGLEARRA